MRAGLRGATRRRGGRRRPRPSGSLRQASRSSTAPRPAGPSATPAAASFRAARSRLFPNAQGAGYKPPEAANPHPTVKPLALMRWLVRLACPDGGLVLDPCCGSGSTGCAAVLEGRLFYAIELDPGYAAIARARIEHWGRHARVDASTRSGA